jgi:hypothetical protein
LEKNIISQVHRIRTRLRQTGCIHNLGEVFAPISSFFPPEESTLFFNRKSWMFF